MKKAVTGLVILSVIIYGIQLAVFHDPSTTAFYILQDFAFLPISIAVATLVVGEVLSNKEKRERRSKTQMLTSNFFTEMGTELMLTLIKTSGENRVFRTILGSCEITDQKIVEKLQKQIRETPCRVVLNESVYNQVRELILSGKENLLIISSNSSLLEQENFTELLWGIFHMIDEFRLHGDYGEQRAEVHEHMEEDLARVLRLLLINWTANVLYTRTFYPNYYGAALGKLLSDETLFPNE